MRKIINQCPHLQTEGVCLLHIGRAGNPIHNPRIIVKRIPGRRNYINACHTAHNARKRGICRLYGHLMPRQIDFMVPQIAGIIRLHISGVLHRSFLCRICQVLFLDIADIAILRLHLIPVFHLLQNSDLRPFFQILQNLTLDAAPDTKCCVLLQLCALKRIPIGRQNNPVGLCIQCIIKIRILLYIIQRKPDVPVLLHSRCISVCSLLPDSNLYRFLREGIQKQLFIMIHIKPLIKHLMNRIQLQIAAFILQQSLFLCQLLIPDNRDLL